MKISNDQIRASYTIAKRVYSGDLTKNEGVTELSKKYGMNWGSARDYIATFRRMLNGSSFTRTINAFATDYYFDNIYKDYGSESLADAISAVQKHIEYYEKLRRVNLNKLREIIDTYLKILQKPIEYEKYQKTFSEEVKKSFQEPKEVRRKRLKVADKLPKKVAVVSIVFARNPDVVAEVLHRSNGICERCKNPAPFTRKRDGSPYLEVHHTIQLANGGEDTIDNSMALCPNCHRELHFGV